MNKESPSQRFAEKTQVIHHTSPNLTCVFKRGIPFQHLMPFLTDRPRKSWPPNFGWLRIAQTISKEVDNNVTGIPKFRQSNPFLAVYYGIDIYPNYSTQAANLPLIVLWIIKVCWSSYNIYPICTFFWMLHDGLLILVASCCLFTIWKV